MKDKKEIADFSRAEDDFSENEYAVTRNKGEKTFADFVDKVIEQISVKNKNKKPSFCKLRDPNDPLTVLRSRGLINIENTPAESDSPASEVDLTLYTEESRIGNVVKVFSSTHRFKNGRLVYSTTQEARPELDEEIDKFNRWWKSQEPGRLKDIDEQVPSLRFKHTRKKLCDLFKDIQKQEIIRRYEMARSEFLLPSYPEAIRSRKNQTSYKSLPSVETSHFSKDLAAKDEKPNFSKEEVILKKKRAQDVCLPYCEKLTPRNISSDYNPINQAAETRYLQSESSDGKVTYRASWLHRSPRKGQRKDSSWIHMSPQKGQRKESSCLHISPRKGQRKDSSCLHMSPQKCQRKDSSCLHISPRKGQRKDSSLLHMSPRKGQRKDSSCLHMSPQKGQRKDSSCLHISPRKGQRKDSSLLHMSPRKGQRKDSLDLRSLRSSSIEDNRELNRKHFGCDLSQNTFQNKVTPFIMASKLQRSMYSNRRSPIRPRPTPKQKSRSSSDGGMGLKSPLKKQSMDIGDGLQICNAKSFKHYINDKNSGCHFPCEQVCECEHLDEHIGPGHSRVKNFNLYVQSYEGLQGPIRASADFDDNGNNSSDNNTSLCTIFYEANGDWISEEQDSCICENHQYEERCHCKNHNKVLEIIPYPSSPMISNKCLTRDCSRDCCYSRKCYTGDSLENDIECFAKCHKKHQNEHEVSIMTGIISNYNDRGLPDEKHDAMKVIESFVNEKALEEFGKRRGNSIHKSNCKTLSTVARQQFCKEINDCFQQRRKMETRKRM